jgi:hypothetical protein
MIAVRLIDEAEAEGETSGKHRGLQSVEENGRKADEIRKKQGVYA